MRPVVARVFRGQSEAWGSVARSKETLRIRADVRSFKSKSALIHRAKRDAADAALLDQADPPLHRAVGEMDAVDVAAKRRCAAERHCPQRTKPGQYRLIEHQLLPRLGGHLGRHPIVVGLAPAECVDVA